jgi:hypothetical protein
LIKISIKHELVVVKIKSALNPVHRAMLARSITLYESIPPHMDRTGTTNLVSLNFCPICGEFVIVLPGLQ